VRFFTSALSGAAFSGECFECRDFEIAGIDF
jgi:hypothetical protein